MRNHCLHVRMAESADRQPSSTPAARFAARGAKWGRVRDRHRTFGGSRFDAPLPRLSRGFRAPSRLRGIRACERLVRRCIGRLFVAGLAAWSDKSTNNRTSKQELHVSPEATRSVPAVAVKQLASTWTQKGDDVLKIRRRAGGCSRVAGSSGPRLQARRTRQKTPLPISKRREPMSWCGKRSPARWRIGPKRMAVSLDLLAAPAAAPVATWSDDHGFSGAAGLRSGRSRGSLARGG